ncbi:MAG: hypothetical protein A2V70_01710 [Planctomycetes bacterium RBG_13_63_9]|nr:MAG: hypothetical protein A2V70_01710 [Planctomycetes bacterium RBG_13_63_9]
MEGQVDLPLVTILRFHFDTPNIIPTAVPSTCQDCVLVLGGFVHRSSVDFRHILETQEDLLGSIQFGHVSEINAVPSIQMNSTRAVMLIVRDNSPRIQDPIVAKP